MHLQRSLLDVKGVTMGPSSRPYERTRGQRVLSGGRSAGTMLLEPSRGAEL